MLPIYFGAGAPRRAPRLPWFVRLLCSRGFWTACATGAFLACLVTLCYGGATIIPADHICLLLNRGEGCTWTVARTMKFKIAALYNEDTQQGAWTLTRGTTLLASAPLPSELGPIAEDDLLNEARIVNHMRYMTGDAAVQAHILALANLQPGSGVAYVRDVYALRYGDGTLDGLASVFSGKVKIEIAE